MDCPTIEPHPQTVKQAIFCDRAVVFAKITLTLRPVSIFYEPNGGGRV